MNYFKLFGMNYYSEIQVKQLLYEQRHNCQTEFDKQSIFQDGKWFLSADCVLKAKEPKLPESCMKTKEKSINAEIVDWNEFTLDELVEKLEEIYLFSNHGSAIAVYKICEFYKQNKPKKYLARYSYTTAHEPVPVEETMQIETKIGESIEEAFNRILNINTCDIGCGIQYKLNNYKERK